MGDASSVTKSYSNFLESQNNYDNSHTSFVDTRLFQENVFPLTVLLIIILVMKLVMFVYSITPVHLLLTLSHSMAKLVSGGSSAVAVDDSGKIAGWDLLQLFHPLRQESAPFTGIYILSLTDILIHTCSLVHIHTCIHTYTHTIHTLIHMYIYVYTCLYMFIYVYICFYMFMCRYILSLPC